MNNTFTFANFVFSVPNYVFRSWVITFLFKWFLEPTFNFHVGLSMAMGIVLLFQLLVPTNSTAQTNVEIEKSAKSYPIATAFGVQFAYFITSLMGLLIGALVHLASH